MLNNSFLHANRDMAKLLAAGLLKKRRHISYTEIEALPMVHSKSDLQEVVEYLIETLKAEKSNIKTDDYPVLRWDTVLTLQ